MGCEGELQLLHATFQKSRVPFAVVRPEDPVELLAPVGFEPFFARTVEKGSTVGQFLGELTHGTLYKGCDDFRFSYHYFLLPPGEETRIVFIGPYLSCALTDRQLLEIGERNGVSPKSQRYLNAYYAGIPVLAEGDRLLLLLDTFCERIWGNTSFALVDASNPHQHPASPFQEADRSNNFDDVLMNMKAMEQRYAFENELMEAVSLGQLQKAELLLSAFSEQHFEKRVSDPLRNIKNYGIIMNTLLRKAAERGGVHPLYLDRVSSDFALQIEQLAAPAEGALLMRDMFRSYCRLVRKNVRKNVSRVVQQTVLLIHADLSADLGLHTLATGQGVSPGYLSAVFRREMGQTLCEYVREKRIHHAAHLLATTGLQVQTVALHCGIMDVQYFSKLFKRQMGMTPGEYRASGKQPYSV